MIPVHRLAHGPVAVAWPANVGEFPNQPRHFRAEGILDVVMGGRGVFHGVVQPGGGDHLLVVSDCGDQVGHCLQMGIVGLLTVLAAVPDALVGAGGKLARAPDEVVHEIFCLTGW